jgi:hypothetical protein
MEARSTGLSSAVGAGRRRAAVGHLDLPATRRDVLGTSATGGDDLAALVHVAALAVDAHRGRDDDPADWTIDQRLEQNGGAEVVRADVVLDLVHALPDAHLGGEVEDRVGAVQRTAHGVAVSDVSVDKGRALAGGRGPLGFRRVAMNLGVERVENADLAAGREELRAKRATDEAHSSRDDACL